MGASGCRGEIGGSACGGFRRGESVRRGRGNGVGDQGETVGLVCWAERWMGGREGECIWWIRLRAMGWGVEVQEGGR